MPASPLGGAITGKENMSAEIGFVGLGSMGLPMATNLAAAGYQLRVYNRTATKATPLVAAGAHLVPAAGDAAAPGGIAISMLSDDAALESVTVGDNGLARKLAPGGIHISMSTVAPATSRRLARYHAECGSIYVGAPVFGRPEAARAKKLWICTAGPAAAREKIRPVLDAMGQAVFDFGDDPGAAHVVKLAGNFLIAANIELMAEAFTMVEKSGVDRKAVAEMLVTSLFACPVFQIYGRTVANKRYPMGISMPLGFKDLDLVVKTATEVKAPMPAANLVRDRMLSALANGRESMDWAALAIGVLEDAGLPIE